MLDDVMYDAATALSLEMLSSRISSPIYEYMFTYEAPFGIMKSMFHVEDGKLRVTCQKNLYSTYIAIYRLNSFVLREDFTVWVNYISIKYANNRFATCN